MARQAVAIYCGTLMSDQTHASDAGRAASPSATRAAAPIGRSIRRREDRRFITGRARYLDDLRLPDVLHAALVRSPHAHARIVRIDTAAARAMPGVAAVFTGADLPECERAIPPFVPSPALRAYPHPAIARGVTRHAGEVVAVVLADDRYRAADAALEVRVDYEVLPAVARAEAALAPGAPRVFAEWPDNVAAVSHGAVGSVEAGLADAQVIVEAELTFPRVAPVPLEPRGVLAWPSAHDGRLTVWSSTQVPYAVRTAIAGALGLAEEHVRILAPDVGGGFGGKGHAYPEEVLVAAVARRLGRSVKWTETRAEHFLAASPDRDQRHVARLGVRADGTITALATTFTRDHGAYPTLGEVMPLNTINHLPGPYRVPHYRATATSVVTHKTFSGAYRGAGRPEAAFVVDRLLDRAARRLGMDPVDLRRQNLVRAAEMPYATGLKYRDGTGIIYDPADFAAGFALALSHLGYAEWRAEQGRRRGTTRPLGLGVSAYVEGTGIGPFEGADVRIDPGGAVYLFVGVACQGQAHETTLAQICAAELGVETDQVVVVGGDTSVLPHGMGTIASRVAAVAGPAIARSAREVARRTRLVAAEVLECAADDVVLANGCAHVAGVPARAVSLGALARAAVRSPAVAREGGEPGLHACGYFYPRSVTWAFGAHACAVEVDVETGAVTVLRYVAVHDCGRPINPMVVEGQIHGGIAQGIGAAFSEELVHDAQGQLLTGSLMDYGLPRAVDIPPLDVAALDCPSAVNELGIKGVGESGVISPSVAIANAVEDALISQGRSDGVTRIARLPLTPARVWEARPVGGAAHSGAGARDRSERADQAAVGVIAEATARLGGSEPLRLVHLVVVLAHLGHGAHQVPADGLLDPLPVALEPVGDFLQLPHDLAGVSGFLPDLTERRLLRRLAGEQRALGQRPHGLIAQIARADEQHLPLLVDHEPTGGELEDRSRLRIGHHGS
jgi:aerobic carbon-monoxide dehydrogenase large subunit